MKTQSEEEDEVKYNVTLCANHWRRKEGNLTRICLMKTYMM